MPWLKPFAAAAYFAGLKPGASTTEKDISFAGTNKTLIDMGACFYRSPGYTVCGILDCALETVRVAMARISDMHKKWMKEPKYRKAYEALEEEFVMASAVMDVRNRAGLTQHELARRMGTTQPVVARLESGRTRPSMRTLERLAEATGSRLLISFEPRDAKRPAGRKKESCPVL